MKTGFQEYINRMPQLMNTLLSKPLLGRDELDDIPNKGIYVFYEDDSPLFVGRSRKLRQYLKAQGEANSDNYTAPFAYKLAKEAAQKRTLSFRSASEAVRDPKFIPLFDAAKRRVANMAIRVIGVTDPIEQTLFVIYAALELGTPYNDFETH